MKVDEAFEILGLSKDCSDQELRSKYRELSKKYHPDVNKEKDAHDVFVRINEANQVAKDFKEGKISDIESSGFGFNISDIFNNIGDMFGGPSRKSAPKHSKEVISLTQDITFKECVLGCRKVIKYKRYVPCNTCGGEGKFKEHNGCADCNGQGMKTVNHGNAIFRSVCGKCGGKTKVKNCNDCNGDATVQAETEITVTIPAGIESGQVLGLRGAGNFHSTDMFGQKAYNDAHLNIKVEKNPNVKIVDGDLVSDINTSLLNALTGYSTKYDSVYGEIDVVIPPKSKNKDEVKIKNHGLSNSGYHRFILNIDYPDDIAPLLEALKETQNKE